MKKVKKILKVSSFIFGILSVIVVTGVVTFRYTYTPIIKLNGSKEVILSLGETYKDEGAKAYIGKKEFICDLYGEIDSNKVGTYELRYVYKSKYFKNSATAIRKVIVKDLVKPIIKLKGKNTISINVLEEYIEPGYEAMDDYDGDITGSVIVTSNLDNKTPGEYTITYQVKDSSGNEDVIRRIVKVKKVVVVDPNKNGDNSSPTSSSSGTGKGIPILMYHFFYDDAVENPSDPNYMSIQKFEEQVKYLVDNNYYFPTWNEIADYVDGKISLPEKSVVITSDDGHISVFKYAIPIVKKYNVRATFFLITVWNKERYFLAEKNDLILFESHTHDMHRKGCSGGASGIFRCINYDLGLADLKESINILESSDAIAYPYGDVTNNVLKITKDAGFKVGVTTRSGKAKKGMDRYQLPRVRMYKSMSMEQFINAIK